MSLCLADYAIPEEEYLPVAADPAAEWCPPDPSLVLPDGTRTPDLDGLDSGTWTPTDDNLSTYAGSDVSTYSNWTQGMTDMNGGYFVPCMITPIGPPTPFLSGNTIGGVGQVPGATADPGSPTNADSQIKWADDVPADNQIVPAAGQLSPSNQIVPAGAQIVPADQLPAGAQIVWCQCVMPPYGQAVDGAEANLATENEEQWGFLHEFQEQHQQQQLLEAGMCDGSEAWFFGQDGAFFQDPSTGRFCWPGAPFCDGSINHRLSHYHVPKVNDFKAQSEEDRDKPITTLMIRNIPNRYTRKMLMCELDSLGFTGQYDFIYVPMDKNTHWNVGYAFVNFVEPESAARCMGILTDYRFRRFRRSSSKVTQVSAAHIQGLEKNMEHYSHTAVQSSRIQSHRPLLVRPRAHCSGGDGRCSWGAPRCRDDMWFSRRSSLPTAVCPAEESNEPN